MRMPPAKELKMDSMIRKSVGFWQIDWTMATPMSPPKGPERENTSVTMMGSFQEFFSEARTRCSPRARASKNWWNSSAKKRLLLSDMPKAVPMKKVWKDRPNNRMDRSASGVESASNTLATVSEGQV